MYIYKFTNLINNKSYIGQTIQDPAQRRLEHISDSKHTKKTYHFHNAIRKYGVDQFSFEVIAEAASIEELNTLEELYVIHYDSIKNGYNIRQPGSNKTHSPESIERMRESQRKAHERRRNTTGDTFVKQRKTSGWRWSQEQLDKHKNLRLEQGKKLKGKTWKLIDGKRVWLTKEASV